MGMKSAVLRCFLPWLCLVAVGAAVAQPKTIAIANFGEHPALRAGIDGFKAELARGVRPGQGRDLR